MLILRNCQCQCQNSVAEKNAIIRRKFAMGSNLKAGKTVYVSSDNVYFFL